MKWKRTPLPKVNPTVQFSDDETLVVRHELAIDMLMGLKSAHCGVVILPNSPKAQMIIDLLESYTKQLWEMMAERADKEPTE